MRMSERDDASVDVTTEATAEQCDASPEDCELDTEHLVDDDDQEPSHRDEIEEAFPVEEIVMVEHPQDGMPVPADDQFGEEKLAVPLTREHCVCLEDERQYVELFAEELWLRGWQRVRRWWGAVRWRVPNTDTLLKLDVRSRYADDGEPRERTAFEPGLVWARHGVLLVDRHSETPDAHLVPVRPKRERCRYYQRQVMPNVYERRPSIGKGHSDVMRNCTMRRSIGGAFLSLRGEGVYACDYREPPDAETVKRYLDETDAVRIEHGEDPEMIPGLFDGPGGIFAPKK